MKIKAFYKKENLFLQSPMSDVQSPESIFWWKPLPTSPERRGVLCLMSEVQCLPFRLKRLSDKLEFLVVVLNIFRG